MTGTESPSTLQQKVSEAIDYLRTTPMLQQVKSIKERNATLVDLLSEALREPVDADTQAAYERGVAETLPLAEEAQANAARLREQLEARDASLREAETNATANLWKVEEVGQEVDALLVRYRSLEQVAERVTHERDEAYAQIERLQSLPAGNDDDSWELDIEALGGLTTLADLMTSAQAMGVVFEIRARRRG